MGGFDIKRTVILLVALGNGCKHHTLKRVVLVPEYDPSAIVMMSLNITIWTSSVYADELI